jgi:hypothetical protein
MEEGRRQQLVLGAEVVGDGRQVDAGGGGDVA